MQIIELLTPAYEAAWLPWAVQYFFLVAVATGADTDEARARAKEAAGKVRPLATQVQVL